MRRRTIVEALTAPAEMPSPVLGLVSGFVPTFLELQERRRQEQLKKELTAATLLARQLAERERRRVILSVPIAQAITAYGRGLMPGFPEIRAGVPYERAELQTLESMLAQMAATERARMREQARLQIEALRNKVREEIAGAKTQQDFLRRMKTLQDMTARQLKTEFPTETEVGVLPTDPTRLLRYRQLQSAMEAYRLSGEVGKIIPPAQWEIRKGEIIDKILGIIPYPREVEEVVPVTPTLPTLTPELTPFPE